MMRIIAGRFRQHTLLAPKSQSVRPTTSQLREAVFNICQHCIHEASFLDLFAGSGAMGLEALSRGASHATFVEKNRLALKVIKQNIASLKVENQTTVYGQDVLKTLERLDQTEQTFDIIYVDPPYGEGFSKPILEFLDEHHVLAKGGTLFIEDSSFTLPDLKHLKLKSTREIGRAHLYEFRF